MAMKLFVGSLAYSVTEDKLRELFAERGEVVSAAVIMDRETGRSKGFGFVEMADVKEGQAAIAALNGKEVEGRTIIVSEARPQESRPSFGGNRGGRGGSGGGRSGGYGGGYGGRRY